MSSLFHPLPRPVCWGLLSLLAACAQNPPVVTAPVVVSAPEPVAPVVQATPDPEPVLPRVALTDEMLYQFLIGEVAQQRGQFGVSARAYEKLAQSTQDPRLIRRAVEVSLRAGRMKEAADLAAAWSEVDATDWVKQRRVMILLLAGEWRQAQPLAIDWLKAHPKDAPKFFMQLPKVLPEGYDKEAALQWMQAVTAAFQDLPEAHYALAWLQSGDSMSPEAQAALERALTLRPDWEPAVLMQVQGLLKDHREQASAMLYQYLLRQPQSERAWAMLGRLEVTAEHLPQALAAFKKAHELNAEDPDINYALGLLAFQLHDYALAKDVLARALPFHESSQLVRYYLGQSHEKLREYDEAIAWYEQVGPGEELWPARYRLVLTLIRAGRDEQALQKVRTLQQDNPEKAVPLLQLEVQVLRELNHWDAAFERIQAALQQHADDADLLYERALIFDHRGDVAAAEKDLRQVLALHPNDSMAMNALGYMLADKTDRLDEAEHWLKQVLEQAPEDPYILDSVGWLAFKQGKLQEAKRYLRHSYQQLPEAEVSAHLVEVLYRLGEEQQGLSLLNESLKLHPSHPVLLKLRDRLGGR